MRMKMKELFPLGYPDVTGKNNHAVARIQAATWRELLRETPGYIGGERPVAPPGLKKYRFVVASGDYDVIVSDLDRNNFSTFTIVRGLGFRTDTVVTYKFNAHTGTPDRTTPLKVVHDRFGTHTGRAALALARAEQIRLQQGLAAYERALNQIQAKLHLKPPVR